MTASVPERAAPTFAAQGHVRLRRLAMWTWWRKDKSAWSWLRGARVAALTTVSGLVVLTLFGGDLEAEFGLGALFQLRGRAPAPSKIVIVAIDRASEERLRLPPPPWPRTVHADLIRTLDRGGAKAIVFDLYFVEERSPNEDEEFAAAMRESGNVVLLQRLVRRIIPIPILDQNQKLRGEDLDEAIGPIPVLRDAAVAVAPFPLPADSARVTRFWTFRSGTDLPTLPSVALQFAASDIAEDWAGILAAENVLPKESQAWTGGQLVDS